MRQLTNRKILFILATIFFLALGLRIWGIGFGLPYPYHPDERGHVVEAARMGAAYGIEPATFAWPPFYAYVLMFEDAIFVLVMRLSGQLQSFGDIVKQISFDPSPLYLLGRATSALFGALTVLVAYALGKESFNRRTGLIAAWFVAVGFLLVRESHYAVNDALLTFLSTLSIWGCTLVASKGRMRDYVLAGIAAGFAFATKYTAAFLVMPLVLGHMVSPDGIKGNLSGSKLKYLLLGGLAFVFSAVAGSPYLLLKPGKVFQDVMGSIYTYGQQGFEGWQLDPAGGYLFYLKSLWWGLGIGLSVLAILGLASAFLRKPRIATVLASYPVLLYLFMGEQQMYFARFILPAIPPLLVLCAHAVDTIVEKMTLRYFRLNPAFLWFFLFGCAMLVSFQPSIDSLRYDFLLSQSDTRTIAKEWIEQTIPQGAKIAMDWPHHTPFLSTAQRPEPNSLRTFDVQTIGGHGLSDHDLQYYKSQGFQYLIASSFIYDIPLTDSEKNSQRKTFYASLDRELTLMQEFKPYQGDQGPSFIFDEIYGPAVSLWQRERPGPILKIYQLAK